MNGGEDRTGMVIESPGGIAIADILDDLADDIGNLDISLGGDFPSYKGNAGGQNRLASHPGVFILGNDRVENSIGDLVCNLIRVSFGNRLRCKQIIMSHEGPLGSGDR